MTDEIDWHEISFVLDNTKYQGHYNVEADIVHVSSGLGSKEERLDGRKADAVAMCLLKDIVKTVKGGGREPLDADT